MKEPFSVINMLNNSKLFAGLVMIVLNIGSKYITIKLTKAQEAFLKHVIAREFLVFAICWMGTRDVLMALILTGIFIFCTDVLFHEDSKYCVFGEEYKNQLHSLIDTNNDKRISQEEMDRAVGLLSQNKNTSFNL